MKNNKGFSLVELIIVIAIMAILVGVMAPQLIKYIEKTNVSSDTQLCDTVKSAITTAMMDPAVIEAPNNGIPGSAESQVDSIQTSNSFGAAVEEILGFAPSEIDSHLKSAHSATAADGVHFQIVNSNSVHVWVVKSDKDGKKKTDYTTTDHWIYVD